MSKIVFLDLETTGLNPFDNEILEVAMIVREDGAPDKEIDFSLKIDLRKASERALKVNQYHTRRSQLEDKQVTRAKAVALLTVYLDGAIVVGNNVQFDLRFIENYLDGSAAETATPWHYHPVDLKALVAGRFGLGEPPWSTGEIASAVGVNLPSQTVLHTAMGDCRWNRDVYDALYAGESA
jgi:DNA polymerase III epsilon subunit-like protein